MQKNGFIAMAVLALGGAAMLRSPLLAGEGTPNPLQKMPAFQGAGAGIEWLARELKLTEAQQQQLSALHRDLEQQADDIRGNSLLSPAEKETRIRALHEGLETRIKAVLTSDQIRKFDQMGGLKAVMGHAEVIGGMRLMEKNGFFEPLDLTDAQKAAVERIMAQGKSAFEAAGGDVTRLRALKQAAWQHIMAVLTPAQQQKLAAAKGFELERGPGDGPSMPELGSLGLTPDQHSRLMSILERAAPRAHAIQEDKSLSDQQKMTQLTALYQEFRPQFTAVLTPAQEQKLRGLLLDRPRGGEPAPGPAHPEIKE
jgi:Spy/CpxP family protein refolding chaperone